MLSQIKDIKHIEQNSVAWVMFQGRDFWVLGAVKTFGLGIGDGAPSTALSSFCLKLFQRISSDKASNLPKRGVRFILLK